MVVLHWYNLLFVILMLLVYKRWPLILYVGCKQLLIHLWLLVRKTRHFSLAIFNCHWLDHNSKRSMATLRSWLHFSTVLLIETSDYYIISEETNCNCCTAAYLFTYCCLLLPVICVALFYGQFFISLVSHFQSHQCQLTTGSCQSHQHLEERNIICNQM